MTLLKERKNNELGNKPYAIKQPVLAASKLNLNSGFATQGTWNKSDIDVRQTSFAVLAAQVWKL